MLSHKGNENQHDIEIPFYPSLNGYHQQNKRQQMLAKMWGKGTVIFCWWECALVQQL
jgi:hypothetical protein